MEYLFLVYLVIGCLCTLYWWITEYSTMYDEAKESEEGVEKGSMETALIVMVAFWPIVLCIKAHRKNFKKA